MSGRPTPVAFGGLPAGIWIGATRVRFADCDPSGIVYFPRFFERAHGLVEDWMEERLGLSHATMIGRERIGLGYAHVQADFFAPARDGDRLRAAVLVTRIGTRSLALILPLWRDGTPILTMRLVMVTTSLATHAAIDLPPQLKAAVAGYAAALQKHEQVGFRHDAMIQGASW